MLEMLFVRDPALKVIGIIDQFVSVIWHKVWFGVGDFELYTKATEKTIRLLKCGNYVTRPADNDVGIIEKIRITESAADGRMILVSGRFAKSILDRRIICNINDHRDQAFALTGSVENAVRDLIAENVAHPPDQARSIGIIAVGPSKNLEEFVRDEFGNDGKVQVSFENLLSWTDQFLTAYGYSATMELNAAENLLVYSVRAGADRTRLNAEGNQPVVFSDELDNLISYEYTYDVSKQKNTVIVGGDGESVEKYITVYNGIHDDSYRREMFKDSSNNKRNVKESVLSRMFPGGTFVRGTGQYMRGEAIAKITYDTDETYTLEKLLESFPTGTTTGVYFYVSGKIYARMPVNSDAEYVLTPLGCYSMMASQGKECSYEMLEAAYDKFLKSDGATALAKIPAIETIAGTLDATSGRFKLGTDFFLGDKVTILLSLLGKYQDVTITEITEVQDSNGYTVDVKYE